MTSPRPSLNLLSLAGSLREGANSEAVLQSIQPLLPAGVTLNTFRLHDIPLYNQDLDDTYGAANSPEPVQRLRHEISMAHGLIISSPEYNYGMPGVLKNALDWLSRPAFNSPMKGKPVLVVTSSIGYAGGARAQHQIRETLISMLARPVVRPDIAIPAVHQSIVDGKLTDSAALEFMRQGVVGLVDEIERLS
jgi:chromate reductase, NAD(P)H dehydrogenase (quinone)